MAKSLPEYIEGKTLLEWLQTIPKGYVTTYQELSELFGRRNAARAVARIVANNSDQDTYPCYKVVLASGQIGGYNLGRAEKIKRLKADGINVVEGAIVDFDKIFYRFNR